MELTERQVGGFKLVSISEGMAAAALELHQGYFTYYWRSQIDSDQFIDLIQGIQRQQLIVTTSITVIDSAGSISELPAGEPNIDIFNPPGAKKNKHVFKGPPSFVRFEGPGQSWVWQYAPDDSDPKESNAPYKSGLAAYAGCASSGDHETTFSIASSMLSVSAIDSEYLIPHLDLFLRYLIIWRERKESWEAR